MSDLLSYSQHVLRTESPITADLEKRAVVHLRLFHGVCGIVTEAGELMNQLKRHIFYGQPLDSCNIEEELGDIEWYMAVVRDILGGTQEYIQDRNVEKLKRRYPDRYSHESAVVRDLDKERQVFEDQKGPPRGHCPVVLTSNEILIIKGAVEDKAQRLGLGAAGVVIFVDLLDKLGILLVETEKMEEQRELNRKAVIKQDLENS